MGYAVPPRTSGPGDRGIDLRLYTAEDEQEVAQCKSKSGKTNVSFGEMSECIGAMELLSSPPLTVSHLLSPASRLHLGR